MSEGQMLQFLQELGEGFTTPPPPPARPVILRQHEVRRQLDNARQEEQEEQAQEQEALLGSVRQAEGAQPDSASSEAASPPTATARSELALPHWAAECLGNKTVDKLKAMAADRDADVLTKTKNILSTLPDLAALVLTP